MSKLLEGKPIAAKIKERIQARVKTLGRKPVLASVMVGENAGSEAYIKSQKKTAEALDIDYQLHNLPVAITHDKLIDFIAGLNKDTSVNGIIIQLPLPGHIEYKKISLHIDPKKDVEGLHPVNMGKLVFGQGRIIPCTAAAVMELLGETGKDLYGAETVIVGHSEIVGKPLSLLLLEKFATVSVCHIGTSKAGLLKQHVMGAEVLIVAVGKAGLIKGEWVREGAIVIDVGINRVEGRLVGDVEFEEAQNRASWITPVPGGVGPLTVTMLMNNLIEACLLQRE